MGVVTPDPVGEYYAALGEREWNRLDRPEGAIEFLVNTSLLAQHLPPKGRVLDLGGGPGRYTQWLAERGHRVVLADLSPELLAVARRRLSSPLVEEIVEANARDLSRWPDSSFDAVLALGPLYHLLDEEDRVRVVSEAVRVLRRGGTVAFALMPVFAFLRRTAAMPDERRHFADEGFVARLLDAGVFINDVPGRSPTPGASGRPR